MSEVGNRYNDNKLRWRNFPLFLMRPLIEVGQQGEKKYGTYNFLIRSFYKTIIVGQE